MLLANCNGKEHLRHRAVSLRQHGFLVLSEYIVYVGIRGFGSYTLYDYKSMFYLVTYLLTYLLTRPLVSLGYF